MQIPMSARRPDGTIDPSKIVPPKTDNQAESETKKSEVDFNAVTIDTKVSCNIDDAVAKMLGWLSTPTALENILIDEHGISEDKLIALDTLVYPLEDHLLELLESAKERGYEIFADENATEEIKNQVINDIEKYEAKINKAKHFKLAIDEELSKGAESELIIDKTASENYGETYIKIISLDRWARKGYGISLHENPNSLSKEPEQLQNSGKKSNATPSNRFIAEPQRSDALRVEIIEIIKTMDNPSPAKVMNALRSKIGSEFTCILANEDDGLLWADDNGKSHVIKIKALGERIRSLLNPR